MNKQWLHKCSNCTKSYDRYSVTVNAIYNWNFLQSQHQETLLYLSRTRQLKVLIINYFLTRSFDHSLKKDSNNNYLYELTDFSRL